MAGGKVASGLIYQIAVITFIVLKLTGVISWAWLWVLSPLWIEGILVALGAAFGLLISRLRLGNPRLVDGFDGVLRGLGEGPVLDLAYELEDGGELESLLSMEVNRALAAVWPRLESLTETGP